MSRVIGRISVATAVAAALFAGCGGDENSEPNEAFAPLPPAEKCPRAVHLSDPPDDSRPWVLPEPQNRPPTPASADLREFELTSTKKGVCVRWTTAARAPVGTRLVFNAHGPREPPRTGTAAYPYGFNLTLTYTGGLTTFGVSEPGGIAPLVLESRVGQSGGTISAIVARSEIDRTSANMPSRPPFPHDDFSFEARVITPPDSAGGQDADFLPDEDVPDALYIDGELCKSGCGRGRFLG